MAACTVCLIPGAKAESSMRVYESFLPKLLVHQTQAFGSAKRDHIYLNPRVNARVNFLVQLLFFFRDRVKLTMIFRFYEI